MRRRVASELHQHVVGLEIRSLMCTCRPCYLLFSDQDGRGDFHCVLVPIDVCYELVGTMRMTWRGFDGGEEARTAMDQFFTTVESRSRPAPTVEFFAPQETS